MKKIELNLDDKWITFNDEEKLFAYLSMMLTRNEMIIRKEIMIHYKHSFKGLPEWDMDNEEVVENYRARYWCHIVENGWNPTNAGENFVELHNKLDTPEFYNGISDIISTFHTRALNSLGYDGALITEM